MARKIIGYTIAGLCFVCFAYLDSYNGNLLPHPMLGAILIFLAGLLAAYIAITSRSKKIVKQEADNKEKIIRLKQTGNRIIVSLDDCEIKENNYNEDIYTDYGGARSLAPLQKDNEKPEWEEVDQSVIVYYYQQGISKYKLISQVFSHDAVSLSFFVENKQVVLYINPDDKDDYFFEIEN